MASFYQSSDLLKYVNITTNKALVLSVNNSRNSPTLNNLLNKSEKLSTFENTVIVCKSSICDLEKNLTSDNELDTFLNFIDAEKSLPFSKSEETLDEQDKNEDKFQIKINVKEDSNLRIGSFQLLSSEEMIELHCGDTNEYINTVNCDFIDKLDQQFVIYYGSSLLIKNSASKNESSFKKSLNINFPKFNSNCKDTIWIFAIKLNLVECRIMNSGYSNNRLFNSMSSLLPLIQLFKQHKETKNDEGNQFNLFDQDQSSNLFNRDQFENYLRQESTNLTHSHGNLTKLLPLNFQNNSTKLSPLNLQSNLTDLSLINLQSILSKKDNYQINCNQFSSDPNTQSNSTNPFSNKPKLVHKKKCKKILKNRNSNYLILKKLNTLEQKIDLIDQKLSNLQL